MSALEETPEMARVRAGKRSVPRPGGQATENASAPYVCGYVDEPLLYRAFPNEQPPVYSLWDLFLRGLRVAGASARCLGYREPLPSGPYRWLTYGEVRQRVVALGDTLVRELRVSRGDRVGIYSKNMKEWTMTLLACSSRGLVPVPVYDSLGADAAEYVVQHSEMVVLFASQENWDKATQIAKSRNVRLVLIDGGKEGATPHDTFDALVARGHPQSQVPTTSEETLNELMIIMYTSGTTGTPKGVMLPNQALVAEVAGLDCVARAYGLPITQDDVLLSYLPLAHIFEQAAEALWLAHGASIAFYCGDVRRLLDDLTDVQPTVFVGVPRVFSRFQERVLSTVNRAGVIRRWLFRAAFSAQSANVLQHRRSWLWDSLIFHRLRERLFPRVRFFLSGAAPLPDHVNLFLSTVFCAPTLQGYGMTETTAGAFVSSPLDRQDCVGCVMPCAEFKLVDIPEMKYTHRDKPCPRGELCIRGPIVTTGYFKNEQATRDAFPGGDDWLATGDVGALNEDGTLSIIDRKKNIFKLAQGEYVAVEALESEYQKAKGVGQVWVYGNSHETQLVAVVVPDPEQLVSMGLLNRGASLGQLSDAQKANIRQALLRELTAQAKASRLKGFEVVKQIHLETDVNDMNQGFTIENDCLTPTFKLKRPQLQQRYQKHIDRMYEALAKQSK